MARSAQTGRKPKANKNIKVQKTKANKSAMPPAQINQHIKKHTQTPKQIEKQSQKRENFRKNILIVFSFENIEDKWIFKLFSRAKQVYKLFISEKNFSCSCLVNKSNLLACMHFEYILLKVAKCKLAFQQLKQKKSISQATFCNLDWLLKQALSSRMIPFEKTKMKQQLCYICMLQRDSKEASLTSECSSCSHKFHSFCSGLWRSLHQNDCPLCYKRLCKQDVQNNEKIELQSNDEK